MSDVQGNLSSLNSRKNEHITVETDFLEESKAHGLMDVANTNVCRQEFKGDNARVVEQHTAAMCVPADAAL